MFPGIIRALSTGLLFKSRLFRRDLGSCRTVAQSPWSQFYRRALSLRQANALTPTSRPQLSARYGNHKLGFDKPPSRRWAGACNCASRTYFFFFLISRGTIPRNYLRFRCLLPKLSNERGWGWRAKRQRDYAGKREKKEAFKKDLSALEKILLCELVDVISTRGDARNM